MRETVQLILELADLGIRIYLDQGKLKVAAPDGALSETILEKIRSQREALCKYLSSRRSEEVAPIQGSQPKREYPLSSSQRSLWVLSRLEESSIAYSIPEIVVFEGALDPKAMGSVFAALIERHEILRTVFRENDRGEAMQVVLSPDKTGFRMSFRDLRQVESFMLVGCISLRDCFLPVD